MFISFSSCPVPWGAVFRELGFSGYPNIVFLTAVKAYQIPISSVMLFDILNNLEMPSTTFLRFGILPRVINIEIMRPCLILLVSICDHVGSGVYETVLLHILFCDIMYISWYYELCLFISHHRLFDINKAYFSLRCRKIYCIFSYQ